MFTKTIKYFIFAILSVILVAIVCFFVSPDPASSKVRNEVSHEINKVFLNMEKRQHNRSNTPVDKVILNVVYGSMIASTAIIYPESSMNLAHYLYGDGTDLRLPNRYFRRSPIVSRSLKKSSYGINGPFSFPQTEDKRLSYVYNPFRLKIEKQDGAKKIKIYQKMVFAKPDPRRPVRTTFWIGKFNFKMSDSLVYVIGNCKPFTAYAVWYQ